MADDFLGKDFDAKTFPFRQPVPFEATANSAVPWGQAIVNEAFESQTIGAGNTGTLSIDIKLPSDYVSILRIFHLQATDPSDINWRDGAVGFAYQQPGGPYKTSVSAFPESQYLKWGLLASTTMTTRDRFSSDIKRRYWTIGSEGPSGSSSVVTNFQDTKVDSPSQIPLWIPPQADTSLQGRSVIIYLNNDVASSQPNHFALNAVFDLYTLEQAYAAGVMSSPRVF